MDITFDAWNSLSSPFSNTKPYKVPTVEDFTFADSSGNAATGLQFGDLLKLGGSALGAYGSLMAGDQSEEAYNYNAQLELTQAKFRNDQMDVGEESLLSTQRAMYAKAGVTMSGSPLDVAVHTASQIEMDKQINTFNAQSAANMDVYRGQVAKSQSEFKAGETLLSGAASLALALL